MQLPLGCYFYDYVRNCTTHNKFGGRSSVYLWAITFTEMLKKFFLQNFTISTSLKISHTFREWQNFEKWFSSGEPSQAMLRDTVYAVSKNIQHFIDSGIFKSR